MDGPIVAAHVRNSDLTPPEQKGGTGIKPHDQWTVPMCDVHHSEQHAIGEPAFERKYSLNLGASAIKLAAMSPHRRRWEDTENG